MIEDFLDRTRTMPAGYKPMMQAKWTHDEPPDGLPFVPPGIFGGFSRGEGAAFRELASNVHNGKVAHVGTANGLSLSYIFNSCQRNGNTIYAIDHFYWQSLEEHLRLWQDQKTVVTMTMSSEEACEHFENGSVDLVFLDSDHTASEVTADILRWIPKLRKFRGVLCGHDYCPEAPGVYQTVRRRFGKQVSVTETFWWVRIDRNAVKRATSRLL